MSISVSDDDQSSSQSKVLVIEKKFCKIYEKYYQISDENVGQQYQILGLLGIMNINGYNFILGIIEKQYVGKLDGANIYIIKNVELFPFQSIDNKQVQDYVFGIKKLLESGFYFSYNVDLTSNRQRMARIRNDSYGAQHNIWDTSDKRYFWNYNICQDFLYQKVDARWIVPIIQGFIEYTSQYFDGKQLEYLLISRRRHAMAGTRYNARGLDDEGNVANFVETEQIICYRHYLFSFVQIRGSVPLFWQQKGIQAQTSIKRSHEITTSVFDKHLTELSNDYRLVIFINLLQKARSNEDMLSQALEKQFQASQSKAVKYTYFDFHTETKGDNFHRLNDLMIKIEDMLLKKFIYFVEDRNTGKIIQEQKGVMRTNCLDCLDRTNVTQTKIAMRILEAQLDKIKNLNKKGKKSVDEYKLEMMGFGEQNDSYIFEAAKEIWAQNGDFISRQYAGTESTITSVTKTGKQGWFGKFDQMKRGVERFFVNNFEDGFKNECIKLLINQHPRQIPYGIRASLEKQLIKYQDQFQQWENIKTCVVTWNCAGNTPSPTFDISNILQPEDKSIVPDLYVIGLQEIVKLNAKSVFQGKDRQKVMLWEQVITKSLNKRQKYICIAKKAMVGCFIMLFTKDEHKNKIGNIKTSKVKTGFGGQSGNKGSVAIRFNFKDSSFAFINCHLTSGQSQVSERLEDLKEIYKKSFDVQQKHIECPLSSHDYKIIFGDLNFRISLPNDVVKNEIKKCNYQKLWASDQLLCYKNSNSILKRLQEGELNFDPSYKYDDHSNVYDSSQKQRIPAWCDRILYEKSDNFNGNLDLMFYGRKESLFSDHRPIYAIFDLQVKQTDVVKKAELEKKLLDQLFQQSSQQAFNQRRQSTHSNKSQNELENKFHMMKFNIDEEYVDINKDDQQKESNNYDDTLQQLAQIDSIDDLINVQSESQQQQNNNQQEEQNQVNLFDNLIDLDFSSSNQNNTNQQNQAPTIFNQNEQQQYQMQSNYFEFQAKDNQQLQQNNKNFQAQQNRKNNPFAQDQNQQHHQQQQPFKVNDNQSSEAIKDFFDFFQSNNNQHTNNNNSDTNQIYTPQYTQEQSTQYQNASTMPSNDVQQNPQSDQDIMKFFNFQ